MTFFSNDRKVKWKFCKELKVAQYKFKILVGWCTTLKMKNIKLKS